jgi:hypothetical protein
VRKKKMYSYISWISATLRNVEKRRTRRREQKFRTLMSLQKTLCSCLTIFANREKKTSTSFRVKARYVLERIKMLTNTRMFTFTFCCLRLVADFGSLFLGLGIDELYFKEGKKVGNSLSTICLCIIYLFTNYLLYICLYKTSC